MKSILKQWFVSIPLTILGACMLSGAAKSTRHPLEPYLGNTMVCAAAETGNDLCHTWLERDGTFINMDPSGMHQGHYTVGAKRADGKVPFCYYYDSTKLVIPQAASAPQRPAGPSPAPQAAQSPPVGQASPAAPPARRGGVLCEIKNHESICRRYDSDADLTDAQKTQLHYSIAERFHHGMCYPLPTNVKPGDVWWEDADPLPGQNGIDKMFLLKGHR